MERAKLYYRLAKPGIIYGNSFALIAGFIFASAGDVDWLRLLITFLATGLVIGSACVFNNIIEADSDAKMSRTKMRATASRKISLRSAIIYGTMLGLVGFVGLIIFTNQLAVTAALVGHLGYMVYTLSKPVTHHSTLIGSLPGAMPPLVGYLAVNPEINWSVVLIFLILVFWQMPHFYAISLRRHDDYKLAKLPVLTVVKGKQAAITQSIIYTALLVISLIVFYIYAQLSIFYWVVILFVTYWLWQMFKYRVDTKLWSKKIFITSLNVLMLWSLMTSIEGFL